MMKTLLVATFAFVFGAVADGGNRAALRACADGYSTGAQKAPEFLAINPMAKVPR